MKIKKVKKKKSEKSRRMIFNRIISAIILFSFIANQSAFGFDSSSSALREMASARSIRAELITAVKEVKSSSPGSLNLQRLISEKLRQEGFLEAVFILSTYEKSPEYKGLRDTICKSLFDRDRVIYYKLLDSVKRLERLLTKEQIEKDLIPLLARVDSSISNPERRALFLDEISGYIESEFLSFDDALKKAQENLFILPQNLWLYLLPLAGMMKAELPVFIARNTILENAWKGLVAKLGPEVGFNKTLSQQRMLRISSEAPFASQIASALAEVELRMRISGEEWRHLVEIYQKLPDRDREKIDDGLRSKGISGGFLSLENSTLGRFIELLADVGIDSRIVEYSRIITGVKDTRRLLKDKRILSDLAYAKDLFTKDVKEADRYLKHIKSFPRLQDDAKAIEEMIEKMRDILIRKITPGDIDTLVSLEREIYRRWKDRTFAYLEQLPANELDYSCGPIFEYLLQDTVIGKQIREGVVFIDDMTARGRTQLQSKLFARVFSGSVNANFVPIFRDRTDPAGGHYYVSLLNRVPEKRPELEPVLDYIETKEPGGCSILTPTNFEERIKDLETVAKRVPNGQKRVLNEFFDKETRKIAVQADFTDLGREVIRQALKNYLCGLQPDDEKAVYGLMLREYLAPPMTMFAKVREYKNRLDLLFAHMKANIRLDRKPARQAVEIAAKLKPSEEITILKRWQREAERFQRMQDKAMNILEDSEVLGKIKEYLVEYERFRDLSAHLSDIIQRDRLSGAELARTDIFKEMQRAHLDLQERFQELRSLISAKLNLLTEGKTEPYSIPRTRNATIHEVDRVLSLREIDKLTFEGIEERIRQYNGALILAEMCARQQGATMDEQSIVAIQALRIPPRVERNEQLLTELAKLKKRRQSFNITEDVSVPKQEGKQKIILVTDIGYDPDDTVALSMLAGLQKEVEIVGVVTCGDPTKPARCRHHKAKLARKILEIQDLGGIPIFSEEEEPVDRQRLLDEGFLGADVFLTEEDLQRPASEMRIATRPGAGVDFIVDSVYKDKSIKIVSIGPTRVPNKVIEKYGEVHGRENISKDLNIFVMGGYLDYDRISEEQREYNFKVFPQHTRQMLISGANIFLLPLDITSEICLQKEEIAELKKSSNPAIHAIAQMQEKFMHRTSRPHAQHDPYTIYAMLHPEDLFWCHTKIDIDNKGVSKAKYAKESSITTAYFLPQKQTAEFKNFLLKNLLDHKQAETSFQNWIDKYLLPFTDDLQKRIEEALQIGVKLEPEYLFKIRLDYEEYLEKFSRLLMSLDLKEEDVDRVLKAFHLAFIAHQLYIVDNSSSKGFWSSWNMLTIEHQFNILKIYTEEFGLRDVDGMVLIMLHDVIEDTYFSASVLKDIMENFGITAQQVTDRLVEHNRRLKAEEEIDLISEQIEVFRRTRIKKELKAIFGEEIANGVDCLSKDLSRPDIEYYHSVLEKGLREHLVKLADRKLNLRGHAHKRLDYQRQVRYALRTRDNFIDLIKSQKVPTKIKLILYDSYLKLVEAVDINVSINELLSTYGCDSSLRPENRNMRAITDTEIEAIRNFLSEDIAPMHKPDENIHQQYAEIEEIIARLMGRISGRHRFLESLLTGEKLNFRRDTYRLREILDLDKEFITLNEMEDLILKARKKFIELGMPSYHAHTNLQDDGLLSPEELVDHAIEKGITVLYVAGHNRMEGCQVARRYAKMRSKILEVRPAVELDASVLGPMAIMHFVAVGPEDEVVVQRMSELGNQSFEMMQNNFRWRLNRILSLADKELFEREFERARVSPRIFQIGKDLKRAGLINDEDDIEELKGKLRRWFSEVKAYADSGGSIPSEFYNKLDVLGKWTNAVWPKLASERRRAMRAFFDILYPDDLVEEFSGVRMPRAQELLREFADLGCRIILAHPNFEIFTIGEVPPDKIEDFKKEMIAMASEGILHGFGAGWGRKYGAVIDKMADEIRTKAGLTYEQFPLTYNIPDFHGEVYDDIRRGRVLKDEDTGKDYYTWDEILPDLKTYFKDGDFLIKDFLMQAEKAFYAREYIKTLRLLRTTYQTYPWHPNIQALRNRAYKAMREAKEEIPVELKQKAISIISQDGERMGSLSLERLYAKGAVALDFGGTIADKKGLGYGIAQEIIELLNAGFRVLLVTTNQSNQIISSMVCPDGTPLLDKVREEARPNLVIYADNLTRKFVYDHVTERMEEVYGYREGKGFKTRREKIRMAMRIAEFLGSKLLQDEAANLGLAGGIKFTIEDRETQLRVEIEKAPADDEKTIRERIKFVTEKIEDFLKGTAYRPHPGASGVYILNRNIDKAMAIEDAVESYGLEEDAIIYIGDGFSGQGDEPVAQKTKVLCVSVSDKYREDIVGNPVDMGGGIETTRAIMHKISTPIAMTTGALLLDCEGTVMLSKEEAGSEEASLSTLKGNKVVKDEIIKLLRMGFKIGFITHNRYRDVTYGPAAKTGPGMESRLIKFIPLKLRRNVTIYSQTNTRKYTFDDKGKAIECLYYSQDKEVEKARLDRALEILNQNGLDGSGLCYLDVSETTGNSATAIYYGFKRECIEKGVSWRELKKEMEEIFGNSYKISVLHDEDLFIRKLVSKDVAVRDYMESNEIPPTKLIYIGDSFKSRGNDLPILKIDGICACAVNLDQSKVIGGAIPIGPGIESTANILRAVTGYVQSALEKKEPEQKSAVAWLREGLATGKLETLTDSSKSRTALEKRAKALLARRNFVEAVKVFKAILRNIKISVPDVAYDRAKAERLQPLTRLLWYIKEYGLVSEEVPQQVYDEEKRILLSEQRRISRSINALRGSIQEAKGDDKQLAETLITLTYLEQLKSIVKIARCAFGLDKGVEEIGPYQIDIAQYGTIQEDIARLLAYLSQPEDDILVGLREVLADKLLEKDEIDTALKFYRVNLEYINQQVLGGKYDPREAALLHPLSRCLWFLTIDDMDVDENIHELYREEELIILDQEASLKLQIATLEEELRKVVRAGDRDKAILVLAKLYYLSLKLDIVMAARKRFVEAGWHSRHTHVAGVGDHGFYGPSELIDLAYQSGLTECLVSSHENVDGSLNFIKELERRQREGPGVILEVVPAAEIGLPEHIKFYLPKNKRVMVAFRDRVNRLRTNVISIYSSAIMAAFERAREIVGSPQKIKEVLKMGPEGDNPFKGEKFLQRVRRQERKRKSSNISPLLPKGVDINDDEAIFNYAAGFYASLLEKAIISLQKKPYAGMPPYLAASKAFAIENFFETHVPELTSDELYFLKIYLKMFGKGQGGDYILRHEGKKVQPINVTLMDEAGIDNIHFSFCHPIRESSQVSDEEELIDKITLAAEKGLRWIELGYMKHGQQDIDKIKEIISKVYERTGILLRAEGSNPDFHGGPEREQEDIKKGVLIKDEDGKEYWPLLLEGAIDRQGIFELEEDLAAPYVAEAVQRLSEADATPEGLLDILPILGIAQETFPYKARHYEQSPSQIKRSLYSRLTQTLGVVQDLSQIEGGAEGLKAETPEPSQRKDMLQRYIWHNDSPIFKDEFASESTIALQKQDIIIIADAIIDEICINKQRHIIDILKAVKSRMSDSRLTGSIDELLESLDKKEGFPLSNVAYQALVWAIRTWPKREYHCHISTSISERWVIEQVAKLFNRGIKPDMDNYKKGTVSYAIAEAILQSLDEKSLRNTLRSIFDDYNKGKLKGKSTALDMPFDLVSEKEKLEFYLNMVSSVVKQYFQDGVFEIELSLNPHKHISYIGLDEYLKRLDDLLTHLEQEADAKFGGRHKVYLKFSLNQVNFEEKGKRQELAKTIRKIRDIKKEGQGDYTWRCYAIDICGKEVPGLERSTWFEDIIKPAQDAGLIFTAHTGDPTNADKVFEQDISRHLDYVADTVSINGIQRIGHGRILSKKDPRANNVTTKQVDSILDIIAENGIGIECCPLRAYRDIATLRSHPLYYWKEKGLGLFFGIDGHYYVPSTLSQWIAQVLLASPKEGAGGYISFADMEGAILPEDIAQEVGVKPSSAGRAKGISAITEKLTQPTSALVSTEAAKLDTAILDKTVSTYQKAVDELSALKAESAKKAAEVAEPLRKAEASLGMMTLSKDIAAEETKIAEKARIIATIGTIIINDAEIPANQEILLTLLDKESGYLKALEEKLGCKVRLLSQFNPDTDTSANMIAISRTKIDTIPNLRYINIKAVAEDIYLPLEQVIVFAKGLLSYNIDKSATTETAISNIYRLLAKRPIQKELFDEFLKPNGVFMLSLPAPTPVDEKYYGDLHKQALAALIAA